MPLHRLNQVTMAVPDVAGTAGYYAEFGLEDVTDGADEGAGRRAFATVDGGRQLRIVPGDRRRLLELRLGVDDQDDLGRIEAALTRLEVPSTRAAETVTAVDPGTEVTVVVEITAPAAPAPVPLPASNAPGRIARTDARAAAVLRDGPVRPKKLGHVVIGSTDTAASKRFFLDALGFKVSDEVRGLATFLRCSTDHHNLLLQQTPVPFLHHTSWQVDDVDEVGRAATAMLAADPSRHVWGLGRHYVGSNFFWYLRDPAGNFTEYYSDLDCIVDDQVWTPGVWEGAKGLFSWGPPPPPSFLRPDDLAALMVGAHRAP